MPFATSEDGIRIHYEVEGSGVPLVLMHGSGGSGDSWRRSGYVARLAETFQCILIDARGRGQSGYPQRQEDYELRRQVMDVAAVLNDLKIQRAHFLGYSTGGWIGWGITIYMPQRFHSLAIGGFGPAADPHFGESVEEQFGQLWHKFADEEQDVVRLIHAETGRFGGARQALLTTKLPLLLFGGDGDPRFPAILGAGQLGPTASFFQLPGKDRSQAFADDDAVEIVCSNVAEFFSRVTSEA